MYIKIDVTKEEINLTVDSEADITVELSIIDTNTGDINNQLTELEYLNILRTTRLVLKETISNIKRDVIDKALNKC